MRQRFTATEIAAMRAVKDTFDPDGLLNPGVLLPDPSLDEPDLPRFAAAIESELAANRAGTLLAHAVDDSPAPATRRPRLSIDPENLTVTAVAGLSLATLRAELAAQGYRCALSDDATNDQQSIRGALSDEIDRAAARACLLAVDVTLPDGPSARFGSNAVKDVAGYDLKRLYSGSGTTYGEVREVTLQVRRG
jgi:glycolate oxidase